MNTGYYLNFVIPQGPTGPTGPTNGLNAYGGKYNTTSSTINLGIGTQSQIPLSSTMPSLNTSYTQTNSITATQAGIYEINFYMGASAALATTLTFAVRANGTNIPATILSRNLAIGATSVYSGSVIVSLAAGSVLDMAISALVAVGVTLTNGTNAILSIKKIN